MTASVYSKIIAGAESEGSSVTPPGPLLRIELLVVDVPGAPVFHSRDDKEPILDGMGRCFYYCEEEAWDAGSLNIRYMPGPDYELECVSGKRTSYTYTICNLIRKIFCVRSVCGLLTTRMRIRPSM